MKQLRHEVNLLPPSGAKVKNKWNLYSALPLCHHGMDTQNFTFSPLTMSLLLLYLTSVLYLVFLYPTKVLCNERGIHFGLTSNFCLTDAISEVKLPPLGTLRCWFLTTGDASLSAL